MSSTIAGMQAHKLGLKPGQRISLDAPPPGWALADPPGGLETVRVPEPADVIVAFFARAAEFGLRPPAWPSGSSRTGRSGPPGSAAPGGERVRYTC